MSCFIVDNESINKLVTKIVELQHMDMPYALKKLHTHYHEKAARLFGAQYKNSAVHQLVGDDLTQLNHASFNARYPKHAEKVPTYKHLNKYFSTTLQFVKCLSCYIYQSCEIADDTEYSWLLSDVTDIDNGMYKHIVIHSKEYNAAPWG